MIRGETQYAAMSRFVKEIPQELMQGKAPAKMQPKPQVQPVKPVVTKAKPFAYLTKGSQITSSSAPDYGPGDRVQHLKFGQGTVLSLEKGARDYEVSVDFDNAGVKKMFAGFAKLKKL